MSYVLPSAPPHRRIAGLAAIVALHAGGLYLLTSGTAREALHIAPEPVETRIIQDIVPPPPPPPPPPRQQIVQQRVPRPTPAPSPLHVPAPEVPVASAPAVETVSATTQAVQSQPAAVPSPPAPVEQAPPPAPPAPQPQVLNAGVVCPNSAQVRASTKYPAVAQRRNITGDVLLEFVVGTGGDIENIQVVGHANSVLANAAIEATRKFQCDSQGRAVRVQVSYSFQMS